MRIERHDSRFSFRKNYIVLKKKTFNFLLKWRLILETTGAEFAIVFLGILSGLLTARFLLPKGKGELTAILLWPQFISGIGALLFDHATIYFAGSQSDKMGEVTGTALTIAFTTGILTGGIGYFTIPYLIGSYGRETISMARMIFLFVPLFNMGSVGLRILQANGRYRCWNILRLFQQLLYLIGILAVWSFGVIAVPSVTYAYLFSRLLVIALAWTFASQIVRRFSFRIRMLKKMLNYGIKAMLGSFTAAANVDIDQLVISTTCSPQMLGFYKVAVSAGSAIKLFSAGFQQIVISEAARSKSAAKSETIIRESLKASMKLLGFSAVVSAIGMPFILPIVYGREYAPSILSAQIICFATVLLGLKQISYSGFRGQGKPEITIYAELGVLLVTVVGLYLFLPLIGIEGAAITSLLAYAIGLTFVYFYMKQTKKTANRS